MATAPAGSTTPLTVTGRGGVPNNATAAILNVTVTEPTAAGFITIYPCDAQRPIASSLNFTAGQTIPNAVIAMPSAAGTICLYTSAKTHLLAADVACAAYRSATPSARDVPSSSLT